MPRAALYARYSSDEQRATSIDDQLRRAREQAVALGYEVTQELTFTDAALSGTAKALAKRAGYAQLLHAWERRSFDAIVVDEVSRLARTQSELVRLEERIEKTRIRLVTTDGIDSERPGWQLQFGISGVIASHFVREMRHRVIRGMVGQLDRGFMIAAPPFGYRGLRIGDEQSGGTKWQIVEEEAHWVRRIYALRKEGKALGEIARYLNQAGVRCPRRPRKGAVAYWRPGTVRQLIQNAIYRGLFVWNGSAFTKAKAKREEREVKAVEYPRPELRLVDDELWLICNRGQVSRTRRGGGKHYSAGLVGCGSCGATLTLSTGGTVPALYCAQCGQAKRVGVIGRSCYYASTNGLRELLLFALRQVLTEERVVEFRRRLRERLEAGDDGHRRALRERLTRLQRTCGRLLELLSDVETDPMLEARYKEVLSERRRAEAELQAFEAGRAAIDRQTLEKQLAVDPADLLPRLFDGGAPAERVRAVLSRLFPEITLLTKPSRFVTHYRLRVVPGGIPAELTATQVLETEEVEMKLAVTASAHRPTTWQVSALD